MNIANKLTMLRIVMVPFVLMFMLPLSFLGQNSSWNNFIDNYGMIVAIGIFLLASLTDTMDGQIARKRNLVTNMGKFLDPIADKLLVTSVLVVLVQRGLLSSVVAIIIISREFIVSGVRILAADKNVVIAASNLGRAKTVIQIIATISIMIYYQLGVSLPEHAILPYFNVVKLIFISLALILTIVSGYDYVKKHMALIIE